MIDYSIFGLSEITLGFIAVILVMILIDLNNSRRGKYELRRHTSGSNELDTDGQDEEMNIAKALGHMDEDGNWIVDRTKVDPVSLKEKFYDEAEDDLKDEIDHYLKNDQGKI